MMEKEFYILLIEELLSSLKNNYDDNYDYYRFGNVSFKKRIKELVNGILHKSGFYRIDSYRLNRFLNTREIENYGYLHATLNDAKSRELLIKIILYRLLGHKKVKLPLSEAGLLQLMDESCALCNRHESIPVRFSKWKLNKCDLSKLAYPIQLYCRPQEIVTQFMLRQYSYQTDAVAVKQEPNEVILDCGACFGDTSLFFANEIGPHGKVYSFEFIRSNVEIFKKNISLNPELAKRISLIEQPVWENSGYRLFYTDNGPASKVGFEKFEGAENQTSTISIDELVMEHALEKVDFIKMDIEGAELSALKGAAETLKKHKPKLAISLYHNPEDFKNIPEFIKQISPAYQFYLNHYTIHTEETILYAIHR